MSYTKTTWAKGDVITATKLNNIETGIYNNDNCFIIDLNDSNCISEDVYANIDGTINLEGFACYTFADASNIISKMQTNGAIIYFRGEDYLFCTLCSYVGIATAGEIDKAEYTTEQYVVKNGEQIVVVQDINQETYIIVANASSVEQGTFDDK